MSEVKISPSWRQAVHDFLAEFKYGDIVPHSWLVERFGLPVPDEHMSAVAFQARQFEWLASIEGFKAALLHDHQVLLQSVRGYGLSNQREAFSVESVFRCDQHHFVR